MSSKASLFLNRVLGEDFMESLAKVELWKPGTRTTLDHEEIRTALQIVPRTVLTFLSQALSKMQIGDITETKIPLGNAIHDSRDATLHAQKLERDVFSGHLMENGKKIIEFQNRSMPGVGLVIMSAFELYDQENAMNTRAKTSEELPPPQPLPEAAEKIQKMIEEKMALRDLVEQVVEKKILQRDALQQLILRKITETLELHAPKKEEKPKEEDLVDAKEDVEQLRVQLAGCGVAGHGGNVDDVKPGDYGHSDSLEAVKRLQKENEDLQKEIVKEKGSKHLRAFLEQREKKLKKNEFKIDMKKGESFVCPDCGSKIFDESGFSGCVCFGDSGKVHLNKSEDGKHTIRFGNNWEKENMEMLLEILRRSRG